MAQSVNKVILVGNLGRDPEVRNTQGGSKIVNITLATSETWSDRTTGEKRERAEWHRVAIFNENIAKIAERFLRKGSKIYIEGELRTRKWTDQSGVEKYTTEVTLTQYRGNLVMLGGNDQSQQSQSAQSTNQNNNQRYQSGSSMSDAAGYDDEVPF